MFCLILTYQEEPHMGGVTISDNGVVNIARHIETVMDPRLMAISMALPRRRVCSFMHSWCVETLWTWRRTQWWGRTWWRPSTQQLAYTTCSWEGPCEAQEKVSAAPKVQHIFTSWIRSHEMGAAANRLCVAFLLLSGTDDVDWSGSSDYTALAKGLRGFIRRAGCITSPRSKLPL